MNDFFLVQCFEDCPNLQPSVAVIAIIESFVDFEGCLEAMSYGDLVRCSGFEIVCWVELTCEGFRGINSASARASLSRQADLKVTSMGM